MSTPSLCTDCQKLGYCRKYGQQPRAESYYKDYPEFDVDFYNRVNNRPNKTKNEPPPKSLKLPTLEQIRAQYRKAPKEETTAPRLIVFPKPTMPKAEEISKLIH
jgi:hypothetical protein